MRLLRVEQAHSTVRSGWDVVNDWNDERRGNFSTMEEAVEYAREYAYYQDFDGVIVPPKRKGGSGVSL